MLQSQNIFFNISVLKIDLKNCTKIYGSGVLAEEDPDFLVTPMLMANFDKINFEQAIESLIVATVHKQFY